MNAESWKAADSGASSQRCQDGCAFVRLMLELRKVGWQAENVAADGSQGRSLKAEARPELGWWHRIRRGQHNGGYGGGICVRWWMKANCQGKRQR